MSWKPFEINDADLRVAEMLKDFIPEKVFDAHAHIHLSETLPATNADGSVFSYCPNNGTWEDYCRDMQPYFSHVKTLRGNMFVMPDPNLTDPKNGLRDRADRHISEQIARHPQCVGEAYVLMTDTVEDILAMLERPGIRGLKCYYYASLKGTGGEADIADFLPEAAWIAADQKGAAITLHMMKSTSLSDPENFAYIAKMAEKYPNAKLVLAHCGRAFTSWTCMEQVKKLSHLQNVWYDLAAVCEASPMFACIKATNAKRVVWGSDYPISMYHGRAISLADGSYWLYHDALKKLGLNDTCLLAGENLLAFRQACQMLDLDQTQLEDLFYNNAMRLFELKD